MEGFSQLRNPNISPRNKKIEATTTAVLYYHELYVSLNLLYSKPIIEPILYLDTAITIYSAMPNLEETAIS